MSEQKVVICKDLKSELQDFLSSLKYDKLFILMDTNTKEKCFPLVEDIPAFQKAPILVMEAGDMNKGFVSLAQIWTALSNEGASRNSLLVMENIHIFYFEKTYNIRSKWFPPIKAQS